MSTEKDLTRVKRIKDGLADSAEDSITAAGQKIISTLISDAATWVMNTYEKWKKSQSLKPKYNELQKYIEISNETVQIGMDKKEIAVMWAMHKLGYSDEETQKVLDMATKAYLPKEKRQQ